MKADDANRLDKAHSVSHSRRPHTYTHKHRGSAHTCVPPEAFAGVASCPTFRHVRLQVRSTQEVSLPRVIGMFTPQDGEVTEPPALQTHPPEGSTESDVYVNVIMIFHAHRISKVRVLCCKTDKQVTSITKESLQRHSSPEI